MEKNLLFFSVLAPGAQIGEIPFTDAHIALKRGGTRSACERPVSETDVLEMRYA